MSESIDTLDISKRLQRKGQSEELAEEFAEILKEREERALVTKRDLAELEMHLLSELRTIKVIVSGVGFGIMLLILERFLMM